MESTIKSIKNAIDAALNDLYKLENIVYKIEHPANETHGDYATNIALILSKQLKQSPMNIANDISYKLRDALMVNSHESDFDEIAAVNPGFINIKISDKWLKSLLNEVLGNASLYGSSEIGTGSKIALEHSNVNPNKAAHVGHLRNACLGQFVERVYECLGYSVDVQYYANNVGVQVATSHMGMKRFQDVSPLAYKKFDNYAWDLYSRMESLINEDEALQQERLDLMKKLEDPRSEEFKIQQDLANKILVEQLKTFSNLGIDYDVVIYESDIVNLKMWEKAFEALRANTNVYKASKGPSEGCWLVKMGDNEDSVVSQEKSDEDQKDLEKDKIIVRSNGVPTYTGKDIAYHMWKYGLLDMDFGYQKWNLGTQTKTLWKTTSVLGADESIDTSGKDNNVSFSKVDHVFDVIGVEQTYAMEAVKKALAYLGFEKQAANMRHINYGFVYISKSTAEKLGMDTSDGKKFYGMSGRKGWGIKIDDLIDMIDTQLKNNFGDFEYLKAVRNGAIKIQMLKQNTYQDLIFDIDDALDTKGYSGPYMQYAYVRTRSIEAKSGITTDFKMDEDISHKPSESEYALLRWLYRFPEIIELSATEFAPNLLSDYLFELSRRYNVFYNSEGILNEPDASVKSFRLGLNKAVGIVLKRGLFLLGIEAPEKM